MLFGKNWKAQVRNTLRKDSIEKSYLATKLAGFRALRLAVCFTVLVYALMRGGIPKIDLISIIKSSVLCYALLMTVSVYMMGTVLGEIVLRPPGKDFGGSFALDICGPLYTIAICATLLPLPGGTSVLQVAAAQLVRWAALFI